MLQARAQRRGYRETGLVVGLVESVLVVKEVIRIVIGVGFVVVVAVR